MVNNIPAAIQAAIAQHQAGDLRAAEQMYRSILLMAPDDAGVVNLLGVILFQQNRLQEAEEKFRQAIELNPFEASFHFNLGNVAKNLGNSEQSERGYSDALRLRPNYPQATQNLCNLLEAQGRHDEASRLIRAAILLNPRDAVTHNKLFSLYERLGNWEDAISFYQQFLVSQTDHWEARFSYAKALQKTDRADLALAHFQAIVQHDPQHARAHFHLSRLWAEKGDTNAALRHVKTAIELDPEFGSAQLDYAGLLLVDAQREAPISAEPPPAGAGLEHAVAEILGDHYANVASMEGWLFTTLIDYRFFDDRLTVQPVQRCQPLWKSCTEPGDVVRAASEHLERICHIGDVATQYAALENLALLDTPSLTEDSYVGLSAAQYQQAIHQYFSGGKLNLVIIGAGPAGLVLASALKLALRDKVNVLLVENRVSSPHRKLPYGRRWATNIPRVRFRGLVEDALLELFARIGKSSYIGCSVNVLESLLFLSCRRMGVKFLFAENDDLSFIRDSQVQMIFDASGNRFQPKLRPESPEQIRSLHTVEADWLGSSDAKISAYGIKIHPGPDNRQITLGAYQDLFFPLHKGRPIKLAMLKLTCIPIRFYEELLSYITQHNADNKYYVWPGTLQEPVNQAIVIINLKKAEYDYLCQHHAFPMRPNEALQAEAFSTSLDERTGHILRFLAQHANEQEHEQIGIEAPFLFEPFLANRTPQQLYGKPLIRIGDSIYNGNMKRGNGLGCHLQHVRFIQKVMRKYVP